MILLITYSNNNLFYTFPFDGTNDMTSGFGLWLHSVMLENETKQFGDLLSGLGIKYVIIRDDFVSRFVDFESMGSYKPFENKWYSSLDPFLKSQKDLVLVQNTSDFKVYENTNYASKIFIPKIKLPQFSSYDDLMKISNKKSISNFITYPINFQNFIFNPNHGSNSIGDSHTQETNGSIFSFMNIGQFTVSDTPENWTTNKKWFGYNHILASRFDLGAFIMEDKKRNNTSSALDIPIPLEAYKNKSIQIWMKVLKWQEGDQLEVAINKDKENEETHTMSLANEFPIFSLIKVFDGKINEKDIHNYDIKIENIKGNNYIDGIYILENSVLPNDMISKNKFDHKTMDVSLINLALNNKNLTEISPLNFSSIPLKWKDSNGRCNGENALFSCSVVDRFENETAIGKSNVQQNPKYPLANYNSNNVLE